MESYDIIQVGAGHNGLIVAAYLAKAGLNVCVLEKQDRVGGGAMTRELSAPGFKDDVCSIAHMHIQANDLIRKDELKLQSKYGLKYIYPDNCATVIFPDDRSLSLYRDVDKTCESIAAFSNKDADSYRKFHEWATRLVELLAMGLYNPPPSISAMSAFLEQSQDGRELMRVNQTSSKSILDEWFESDALKIAGSRFAADFGLPFEQMGTGAAFFNFIPIMHKYGMALPEGGSGALAMALERCIRDLSGTIKTDCGVKKFITKGGECKGVVTESGEEFHAKRAVVTNLNIKQFPSMVDQPLPEEFINSVNRVRISAYTCLKVDLALHNAIHWKAEKANSAFFVYPISTYSLSSEQQRYHELSMGLIKTDEPLVSCQTIFDPTRAPGDKHTLYALIFVPPHPLGKGIGCWNEIKDKVAGELLETIKECSTNMDDENIIGKYINSPLDFADMNDAWIDGEPFHIGHWMDQIMQSRPFLGWYAYRSPIKNLYMCGASCYPTGGISGSGRATAITIMEDLGIDFEKVIKN